MLKRTLGPTDEVITSSFRLVEHITSNKATLTVIDPYRKVLLEDVDFDEMIPLGEGTQGVVYAVAINIDEEEQRFVVKRLKKQRYLPSASISACASGASFVCMNSRGTYGHYTPIANRDPATNASFGSQRDRHTSPGENKSMLSSMVRHPLDTNPFGTVSTTKHPIDSERMTPTMKNILLSLEQERDSRKKKPRKVGVSFDKHFQITKDDVSFTDHNIIKLICIIDHGGEKYALLPYCEFFLDLFMEERMNELDSDQRIILTCEIVLDILNAIRHLNYTKNHTHRDIKPENIAFCQGKWCILDFECAAEVGQEVKGTFGSPFYMHPWCFVDSTKSTFPGNDLYAVGQIMRQLLLLPSMFHSTTYYNLVDEKIAIHKTKIAAKWGESKFPVLTDDTTPIGKLTRLSEQMSGLMSDQPDIDDIMKILRSVYDRLLQGSSSSNMFSDLYESSRSDGYFSSSQDKAKEYMKEVPKVLERRRSSWGGILNEVMTDSDDDDCLVNILRNDTPNEDGTQNDH